MLRGRADRVHEGRLIAAHGGDRSPRWVCHAVMNRVLDMRVLDMLVGLLGRGEDFWDEELWVDDPLVSWGPAERHCHGSEHGPV